MIRPGCAIWTASRRSAAAKRYGQAPKPVLKTPCPPCWARTIKKDGVWASWYWAPWCGKLHQGDFVCYWTFNAVIKFHTKMYFAACTNRGAKIWTKQIRTFQRTLLKNARILWGFPRPLRVFAGRKEDKKPDCKIGNTNLKTGRKIVIN